MEREFMSSIISSYKEQFLGCIQSKGELERELRTMEILWTVHSAREREEAGKWDYWDSLKGSVYLVGQHVN